MVLSQSFNPSNSHYSSEKNPTFWTVQLISRHDVSENSIHFVLTFSHPSILLTTCPAFSGMKRDVSHIMSLRSQMCVFLCVRVCVCVTVAHMMPCWVYQPAGCTDTVLKWGSICWVSCVPSFLTHTRTPHYVTSSFRLEPNTTLPVFHRWMFEVYHLATTKCGQRNYFHPKYFWKINFCCHFVVWGHRKNTSG